MLQEKVNPIDFWYQKYLKIKLTENENTLNWQDIKYIVDLEYHLLELDIDNELPKECETEEGYYSYMLNEFNKWKHK